MKRGGKPNKGQGKNKIRQKIGISFSLNGFPPRAPPFPFNPYPLPIFSFLWSR